MKAVVLIFSLFALAAANPVFLFAFNEVQAAPDSLERVEIHPYNMFLPVDIFGWQLQTVAGICTVQTHIVIDSADYAVLDRTNLGPAFTLGDEHDSLVLFDAGGSYITETGYPDGMMNRCLAPPAGASAAFYHNLIWQYPDPIEVASWYIDASPTFGSANDDTVGGIRGRVVDDRGEPVIWAQVTATGAPGEIYMETDSSGHYELHPTGPGTYWLSADRAGYEHGSFSDSVAVASNEWVDSVNIVIVRTGVAETRATIVAPGLTLRGRTLSLDAPGQVAVFDLSGRPVVRSTARTISLAALSSGVYFVRLETVAGVVRRKVVLF